TGVTSSCQSGTVWTTPTSVTTRRRWRTRWLCRPTEGSNTSSRRFCGYWERVEPPPTMAHPSHWADQTPLAIRVRPPSSKAEVPAGRRSLVRRKVRFGFSEYDFTPLPSRSDGERSHGWPWPRLWLRLHWRSDLP